MFGTYFYNQRIRKSVALFGRLFNNIYVIRKDSAGKVISQVKVPLAYAPRRKFLERIVEQPDLDNNSQVAVKLPRMSFEILSYTYDASRQLQKTNSFTRAVDGSIVRNNRFYAGVPYNITFQLNIYAKNQDDALQVVEQIIPYFNPQYTLTMKPFEGFPTVKEDVPIVLSGVSFTDDYEGQLENRRTIIYTLDFDMKINFYGPVDENGSIIRDINVNLGVIGVDSDYVTSRINIKPDPLDAGPDSDFGFTTVITSLVDSG